MQNLQMGAEKGRRKGWKTSGREESAAGRRRARAAECKQKSAREYARVLAGI